MTYYGDEAFPSPSDEQWARLQSYGSAQEVESGRAAVECQRGYL